MLNIKEDLLTNHNRPKKKLLAIKALIIHYTANENDSATAQANRNYFQTTTRAASAHYIVDQNSIIRCIPDNEVAYHVGANSYTALGQSIAERRGTSYYGPNFFTIGIEICNNLDWNLAVEKSAQLAAELLKKHNLTVKNMYRHYDITGKNCPAPMVTNPQSWEAFKKKVADIMNPPVVKPASTVKDIKGTVTVIVNGLNVRSTADSSSKTNIVGVLAINSKVKVTGSLIGWYRVDYNGKVAYISSDVKHVKFEEEKVATPVPTPTPAPKPAPQIIATVLVDSLNVRSTADSSSKTNIVGSLTKGKQAKVINKMPDGKWLKIEFNGKIAYISADPKYVKL